MIINCKKQKDRWRLAQEYQKRNQLKKKERLTSFNHSQTLYSEEPYLIKFLSQFKKNYRWIENYGTGIRTSWSEFFIQKGLESPLTRWRPSIIGNFLFISGAKACELLKGGGRTSLFQIKHLILSSAIMFWPIPKILTKS